MEIGVKNFTASQRSSKRTEKILFESAAAGEFIFSEPEHVKFSRFTLGEALFFFFWSSKKKPCGRHAVAIIKFLIKEKLSR